MRKHSRVRPLKNGLARKTKGIAAISTNNAKCAATTGDVFDISTEKFVGA